MKKPERKLPTFHPAAAFRAEVEYARTAMAEWLILLLLVPAIVVPVVLLVGFAGCAIDRAGRATMRAPPVMSGLPIIDSAVGTSISSITLTWRSLNPGAATFQFERTRLPGGAPETFPAVPEVLPSPFIDTGLEPATSYSYRVRSFLGDGNPIGFSGSVTGTTLSFEPTLFDVSFLSNAQNTADEQSYTFSAVGFGAEDSTRRIIVAIAGRNSRGFTISSVTIGGVIASEAVSVASDSRRVALYIASVPTGSSGDIVIQFSDTSEWCGIAVWRGVGFASNTPTATATQVNTNGDPGQYAEASLNIPSGGGGVGYIAWNADSGGSAPTWTWTGLTEDFDATIEDDVGSSGARSLTSGTATRRATGNVDLNNNGGALVLAAWGSL